MGTLALSCVLLAPGAVAAVDGPLSGLDLPGAPVHQQPRAGGHLDTSQNLVDHGGPVVHASNVWLIFWDPSNYGLTWDTGYRELMTRFIQDVAADAGKQTNAYSLTPQYANASGPLPYNTVFGGRYDDSDAAPASDCTPPSGWSYCLKSSDLSAELRTYITAHSLPTGMGQIYMVVTPQGLGSCNPSGTSCLFQNYCAFHSDTEMPGGTAFGDSYTVLWGSIPYTAGVCRPTWPRPNNSAADTTISSISHEDIEILTDPLPGAQPAWQQATTSSTGTIGEIADLCASFQGHYLNGSSGSTAYDTVINGHPYNIQGEWSNADASCQISEAPVANFAVSTSAARLVPGSPISFNGSSSADPDGSIASYTWSFGDGSAGSGATPGHTYASGGTYRVTLTVTDNEGTADAITIPVTVDEAPSVSWSVSGRKPGVFRPVAFRAAGLDPDGYISSYAWRFGDGTAGSGSAPSHIYARSGNYTVTVSATDSSGQSVSATKTVHVAQMASITSARTAKSGGRRVLILQVSGSGAVVVQGHRVSVRRRGQIKIPLKPTRKHKLPVKFVPRKGPPQQVTVNLR